MDQRTGIKRERERNVDIIQAPVEGVPEKRARNSQEQYGTIQLAASTLRYSEQQVIYTIISIRHFFIHNFEAFFLYWSIHKK